VKFVVYGTPRPQGSMRAFFRPGMKHAVITSDNAKLKPWRQQITETAIALGITPVEGPIVLVMDFFFTRPKSAKKRVGMTVKPDSDKLARGCLDALTGVAYRDDSQVVDVHARKHYGEPERVEIHLVSPQPHQGEIF